MKLINESGHAAEMIRTSSVTSDDHMLACIIARPTYRVEKGALVATPEDPWPIANSPTDTPLGEMPGDKPFYMGGIDVLLGGKVRQPGGNARPTLDVELQLGSRFRRKIKLFGDRVWAATSDGKLTPSDPKTFVSMALDYEKAFGGKCPTEHGTEMPFGPNPRGTGFYLDDKSARGKPLPNLEHPGRLIKTIHDMPDPVGLGYYPADGSLRPMAALKLPPLDRERYSGDAAPDLGFTSRSILPTVFNMGHPDLFIEAGGEPKAGETVTLTHGLRDEDLTFLVPDLRMHVTVLLEESESVFPMHLDQIGIVAGEGRVFFSLRSVVEYPVREGERRSITLRCGPAPASAESGR